MRYNIDGDNSKPCSPVEAVLWLCRTYYNVNPRIRVGGQDRSAAIRRGFMQAVRNHLHERAEAEGQFHAITDEEVAAWAIVIFCYAHIMREVVKRRHLLTNLDYLAIVKKHVRWLHLCRTKEMMQRLAVLVGDAWNANGGKKLFDWFSPQYLTDPWLHWYITVSGIASITPNQNPLESYQRAVVRSKALRRRQSFSYFLSIGARQIMASDILHNCGDILARGSLPPSKY